MSAFNGESKPVASALPASIPLGPSPPSSVPTATLATPTAEDKVNIKQNPIQYYAKASFMITYILLLTTATITFIEALTTTIPGVRHVLNLETAISIIAGYFYSVFLGQFEAFSKDNKQIDWSDITKTRYVDWIITTPIMLFALSIVLSMNVKKTINLSFLILIIVLNYIMLLTGYLGEVKVLSRAVALFGGFAAFFAMFYLIFINFIQPKYVFANTILYVFYIIIWGLYGVAYMFSEEYKNIFLNILDCIAKCFVGLGLWVYYTKTISV